MTPDKLHEAIAVLTRAEHLLVILHERIHQTDVDQPSEELTLTIRDGLAELKQSLIEEERRL
jgi:hypothetical protein